MRVKKEDELGVDEIGERMEGGMEMVRWEKNVMKDGQIEYRKTKQQNKNQNKRVTMKDIKVRYKESRNETEKIDSTVVRMRKMKYE